MATQQNPDGPVQSSIRHKVYQLIHSLRALFILEIQLKDQLQPSELIITNDSWQHRHHAAMKAEGGGNGETHFSVKVVSDEFKGKSTMQRHRMIYAALSEELSQGLHALSLKTVTTEEAEKNTPPKPK
ncbi:hypothetical protein HWV62_31439 [Athelia sp. TMB]|nr:hypothetical protein HWV62_37486 [Athelia sp. TMB]KAF7981874.1 hypothetical protein HWV62_31439 [Athelia sp. TMB]